MTSPVKRYCGVYENLIKLMYYKVWRDNIMKYYHKKAFLWLAAVVVAVLVLPTGCGLLIGVY